MTMYHRATADPGDLLLWDSVGVSPLSLAIMMLILIANGLLWSQPVLQLSDVCDRLTPLASPQVVAHHHEAVNGEVETTHDPITFNLNAREPPAGHLTGCTTQCDTAANPRSHHFRRATCWCRGLLMNHPVLVARCSIFQATLLQCLDCAPIQSSAIPLEDDYTVFHFHTACFGHDHSRSELDGIRDPMFHYLRREVQNGQHRSPSDVREYLLITRREKLEGPINLLSLALTVIGLAGMYIPGHLRYPFLELAPVSRKSGWIRDR